MSASGLAAVGSAVALAAALTYLRDTPTSGLGHGLVEAAGVRGRPASRGGPARALALLGGHAARRHVAMGVVAGLAAGAVAGPLVGVVAAAVAAVGSVARDRRAASTHARRCEAAAPALARALADALRGGASIRGAVLTAADDGSIPGELRSVVEREASALGVGAPTPTVLRRLSQTGGPAVRLLCGTIALHLESGGALATELDRIARTAEAARKVEEDRLAATAQARATVRVVAALPLLAIGGAQLASPGFLTTIASSPVALALLVLGLALEVVAILAARVIVRPAS